MTLSRLKTKRRPHPLPATTQIMRLPEKRYMNQVNLKDSHMDQMVNKMPTRNILMSYDRSKMIEMECENDVDGYGPRDFSRMPA